MCGMISMMFGFLGVLTGFMISKTIGLILLSVAGLFGLVGSLKRIYTPKATGWDLFIKAFGFTGLALASVFSLSVFIFA